MIYYKSNNYEAALKLFLKTLEINSKNVNAYLGRVAICIIMAFENKIRIADLKSVSEENKFDLSIKYYEEMFNIKASSFIGFANLLAFNKISLILEKILYFFFKDNKIVSPSTMEHLKQYIDDNSEDIWIKLFMG